MIIGGRSLRVDKLRRLPVTIVRGTPGRITRVRMGVVIGGRSMRVAIDDGRIMVMIAVMMLMTTEMEMRPCRVISRGGGPHVVRMRNANGLAEQHRRDQE